MRGKRIDEVIVQLAPGITPADAGKTNIRWLCIAIVQDHPRGCGENFCFRDFVIIRGGSPPRMRGKLVTSSRQFPPWRITPADAGKTGGFTLLLSDSRDHPRGCGENIATKKLKPTVLGSPPRMRGKLANTLSLAKSPRITPADAGKTNPSCWTAARFRDHPRGCGENPVTACICSRVLGSPPRMRGKPPVRSTQLLAKRITPADAGKTPSEQQICVIAGDHPRGCGENGAGVYKSFNLLGSPPRMRGKRPVAAVHRTTAGITPADAGKTRSNTP